LFFKIKKLSHTLAITQWQALPLRTLVVPQIELQHLSQKVQTLTYSWREATITKLRSIFQTTALARTGRL